MAFTQSTFAPIATNSTQAPRSWSYQTSDTLAEVLTPGYFSPKRFQLSPTDFIWVITSDAQRIIRYDGEIEAPEMIAPRPPELVLLARDFTDQQPGGTSIPMQISFDTVLNLNPDVIDLSPQGTVTILKAGIYNFNTTLNVGRTNEPGLAEVFIRGTLNDVPFGSPICTLMENQRSIIPEQFLVDVELQVGDFVKFELILDGAGVGDGGLFSCVSTEGWGNSASAVTRISRLV